MRDIWDQIESANTAGLYYVALSAALAVPDIVCRPCILVELRPAWRGSAAVLDRLASIVDPVTA